jgi:outer membrane lipoprotein-sorting protein
VHARTSLLVAVFFGLVVIAGGCGGDEDSTTSSSGTTSTGLTQESTTTIAAAPLIFTAALNGANQVPPVTTNAKGTLTLTVQPDGTVDYVITITKLTNVTVARLRGGKPGASTGVIVTLRDGPTKTGTFTGVLAEGSFTAKDLDGPLKGKSVADLVALIESGNVFLNVGNSSHKSGAICGQVASSSSAAASTTTIPSGTTISPTTTGSQPGAAQGGQSLADLLGQYKQAASLSLDFAVTTPEGQTTSGKMWEQAGKMLKMQTTAGGIENVMIIDLTANTMTIYEPSTKQGMKSTVDVPFQDPASYAGDVDVGDMQDLGTEVVDGETCRVVQYTTTEGSTTGSAVTVKMWLSERLGFPVKVTSTTADGKTTTMTYSNIKVGELPSGTFEVPADVTIMTAP